MSTRLLIVHNEPVLPDCDPEAEAERAVATTVAAVREHLGAAGFSVECLAIGRNLRSSLAEADRFRSAAILNLFEGLGDDPTSEARVARALESLAVPLSGCSARALRLAGRKHRAKAALTVAGLPTPKYAVVAPRLRELSFDATVGACGASARERPPSVQLTQLRWPLIAKPALYHASIGIEQASVATNSEQLIERIEHLLGRYRGPVLVEEFIRGREFTVAVLETPCWMALGPMEFEFVEPGCGRWPLVTFDAKWRPESQAYQATPARHGPSLDARLDGRLRDLACRAFRTLGCRDYARVDFRVDAEGEPWILEVNPNPDLSPAACLAGALAFAGFDYGQWIVGLARAAIARGRRDAIDTRRGGALPSAGVLPGCQR